MKIKNNNAYRIMYGMDFLNAGEVKEIDDKTAKKLLNQPGVEEYADIEELKQLKEELKKQKSKKEEK